jgi:Subtilase family
LYYAIECPRQVDPEHVVKAVSSWPQVEIAYVEGGPVPPPVNPSDDPRTTNQRYLNLAPKGINARWAWKRANGAGVRFVDLERGWTLNHEDLVDANITVISGLSQDFHGHGTAVLGEVVAVDNTRGGIGIAPNASARVVSQWRNASTYNTAEAILSAVSAMSAGDVLLLEAQTNYSTYTFVPVEVEQAVFDAIQFATSQGIVVVEAAGNGAVDLDTLKDVNGKMILNRRSVDFRDSGAIMVGAASSAAPHQRLSFSNYGSRIDCFGWGENIDTCGDGWTGTGTTTYTSSFGGTSGASPIVTGAALLMQSWRVANGMSRYSPNVLRALLSDVGINTKSANPASDRIGVMPDLRAILKREDAFWWFPPLAWAWLIIVGGLLITPRGTWCIRCGARDPHYIGDRSITVLGVISVLLGVIGLVRLSARASLNSQLSIQRSL